MNVVVEQKARNMLWRQMQRGVNWLLSNPPRAKRTLGPASHNELIQNFLKKSQKLGDNVSHLRLLDHFGTTLQHTIKLELLDEHLTIALAQPALPNAQQVKLATVHIRLLIQRGELERAQQTLDAAWRAADTAGLQAKLYNRLGVLLEVQEKYKESEEAYIEGLRLAEESGDLGLVSTVYNNLGNWAFAQDQHQQALRYYQNSLESAKSLKHNRIFCARAEGGLAMTFDMLKLYDDARHYYQIARRHYEEGGNLVGLVRIDLNLSAMLTEQGHYAEAKQLASRARIEAHKLGDLQREAAALHALGNISFRERDYESASQHLVQALKIRQWLGMPLYKKSTLELMQKLVEAIKI